MKTQTDMVSNERLSALGLTLIKERNGISEYKLNANGLEILLIPNQSSQAATVMHRLSRRLSQRGRRLHRVYALP